MAVGAEQKASRRVIHGTVGIARSFEMKKREHAIDLRGRAGKKKPSRLLGAARASVLLEFGRPVVLGVDRYLDEGHLTAQLRP